MTCSDGTINLHADGPGLVETCFDCNAPNIMYGPDKGGPFDVISLQPPQPPQGDDTTKEKAPDNKTHRQNLACFSYPVTFLAHVSFQARGSKTGSPLDDCTTTESDRR